MRKNYYPAKPMNLHLFDGAASAGDGGASPSSSAAETSGTTTTADNTQSANGRGADNNGATTKQDDAASRQDTAVTLSDDEKRAQFKSYINGEGKPYFDEHFQKVFNSRYKEAKTLEENAKTIEPMLRALAANYDVDSSDLKALSEAVLNDQRWYEERARENGVSVDVQMKFDKIQRQNDQLIAQQEQQEQRQRTEQILNNWNVQAEDFRRDVPDFDLDSALENKAFFDLMAHGFDVKTAYNAAFPDQFEKRVAAKTEKQVTDNIRSRGMRATENGVSSSATATQKFDVKNLTPAQRRELANRALRGENVTFK